MASFYVFYEFLLQFQSKIMSGSAYLTKVTLFHANRISMTIDFSNSKSEMIDNN